MKLLVLLFSLAIISVSCGSDDSDTIIQVDPDADGDGVPDKDDECPNEAGLAALAGCPDADADGIADKDDTCPNEAGLADLAGCPDADADGIADQDDACPDMAGSADSDGCPDVDGDGISDMDDVCPNEAGIPFLDGCPADPDAEESTEPVGPSVLRFNAGGGEVTIGDVTFLEDQYFIGNTEAFTNSNVTEIENTDLDEIYLTERVSLSTGIPRPFSYVIPIENGTYTVKFHFAEIFWGVENDQMVDGGTGSRLFDLDMEEQNILNTFDIFAQAGGAATAITKMYDIEVTDGVLNIDFTVAVDRPKVSAIEIFGNGAIVPQE